ATATEATAPRASHPANMRLMRAELAPGVRRGDVPEIGARATVLRVSLLNVKSRARSGVARRKERDVIDPEIDRQVFPVYGKLQAEYTGSVEPGLRAPTPLLQLGPRHLVGFPLWCQQDDTTVS